MPATESEPFVSEYVMRKINVLKVERIAKIKQLIIGTTKIKRIKLIIGEN